MTQLNAAYMRRRGPTDVLSFPAAEQPLGRGAPKPLGDLILCPPYIRAQAKKHRRRFRDELAQVAIHGVLHLLGYDHLRARDAKVMRALEALLHDHAAKKLLGVD